MIDDGIVSESVNIFDKIVVVNRYIIVIHFGKFFINPIPVFMSVDVFDVIIDVIIDIEVSVPM